MRISASDDDIMGNYLQCVVLAADDQKRKDIFFSSVINFVKNHADEEMNIPHLPNCFSHFI